MSDPAPRPPRMPPPWFVHTAWRVHRALYRLSGGRFLWTTKNKQRLGSAAPHHHRAEIRAGAQRHHRLPRGGSRPGHARDERLGRGPSLVVGSTWRRTRTPWSASRASRRARCAPAWPRGRSASGSGDVGPRSTNGRTGTPPSARPRRRWWSSEYAATQLPDSTSGPRADPPPSVPRGPRLQLERVLVSGRVAGMPEPTGNAAFDEAHAGGVVDTFLSFPDVREAKAKVYDYIRKHPSTRRPSRWRCRRSTCSRTCPSTTRSTTPSAQALARDGRARHPAGSSPASTRTSTGQAGPHRAPRPLRGDPQRRPQHRHGGAPPDRRRRGAGDRLKAAAHLGHRPLPQVPINDKKMYPIYAKCVELDLPIFVYVGVPGPRIPIRAPARRAHRRGLLRLPRAHVRDAPRRRALDRAGGEADAQVAEPLLLDVGVRPEALPEGHHRLRQHPRRRQGHVRRLLPGRAELDRIFAELPDVPFKDDVWPKFLRENAEAVFGAAPHPY